MTVDPVFRLLLFVIGALVIATVCSKLLIWRHGRNETLLNFQSRTYAWWVMVLILALALFAGRSFMLVLYAGLSVVALHEFLQPSPDESRFTWTNVAAYAIVIPVQYLLIWLEWYGLFAVFIPVYVFLSMPILALQSGKISGYLHKISELHWGLMLAVYSLSHVPAILLLKLPLSPEANILLLAFLVLVVQSSDVLQYIWGKLFGRHKLAPSVSPSKTIEGLIGGIATACVIGVVFSWLTPFNRLEALGISFMVALMGFFGGFVLSAVKRDRGVKDWGSVIPGHGGILDRVDSLVFAAPLFFHIVRYWWSV